MNIYQQYRPYKWADVIGHDKIVAEMKKRSIDKAHGTAYFLTGISGTGKSTIARLIAMSIKCENLVDGEPCGKCKECRDIMSETFMLDNFTWNGADFNKDEVSQVRQILSTKSILSRSGKKIVFIDEFQKVLPSSKAHDEFLTILETKRPNVHFLLTSMDDSNASKALKNRTEILRLHEVPSEKIAEYLLKICTDKKIQMDRAKAEILLTIAENAQGSVRMACSYLEICIYRDIWNEEELLKEIDLATPKVILNMCGWLLTGNIELMNNTISEEVLTEMRKVLLLVYKKQMGIDLGWQNKLVGSLHLQPIERVVASLEELNKFQTRTPREVVETSLLNLIRQNRPAQGKQLFAEKILQSEAQPRRRAAAT